jgi:hypothetical protein
MAVLASCPTAGKQADQPADLAPDGYITTVKLNTQGKQDVVIVQHNSKPEYDPAEPRSADYYSRR